MPLKVANFYCRVWAHEWKTRKNENKQTIIGKSEKENNSQALNVVHRFMSGAS